MNHIIVFKNRFFAQYPDVCREIQEIYGPRSTIWNLTDILIQGVGGPIDTIPDPACSNGIIIRISAKSYDEKQYLFQYYHECVHVMYGTCLDPKRQKIIEEGIAAYFQLEIKPVGLVINPQSKYGESYLLTKNLLQKCPSAIRDLRCKGIDLNQVTPDQILGACPQYDNEMAVRLCELFYA